MQFCRSIIFSPTSSIPSFSFSFQRVPRSMFQRHSEVDKVESRRRSQYVCGWVGADVLKRKLTVVRATHRIDESEKQWPHSFCIIILSRYYRLVLNCTPPIMMLMVNRPFSGISFLFAILSSDNDGFKGSLVAYFFTIVFFPPSYAC